MCKRLLALVAVALPLLAEHAAAGEKSDSKVKVGAVASKPADGMQTIVVTIKIDEGWYIYANPVNSADFDVNKTELTIWSGKKAVPAKVEYPEGKTKKDDKLSYSIYQDMVVLRAQVKQTDEPLMVEVRVSACSFEGQCLLPGSKLVKVP